jgi:hypothetical protein
MMRSLAEHYLNLPNLPGKVLEPEELWKEERERIVKKGLGAARQSRQDD